MNDVRDKPAERGITINNILLSIVVIGGSIFSTIVTSSMTSIQNSMDKVEESVTLMKVDNSVTTNEVKHIHATLADCQKNHENLIKRIRKLETGIFNIQKSKL